MRTRTASKGPGIVKTVAADVESQADFEKRVDEVVERGAKRIAKAISNRMQRERLRDGVAMIKSGDIEGGYEILHDALDESRNEDFLPADGTVDTTTWMRHHGIALACFNLITLLRRLDT